MTRNEYLSLIDEYPDLLVNGFGVPQAGNLSPSAFREAWLREREALKEAQKEFAYCCAYLMEHPELKGRRTSFHWKHVVEEWLRRKKITPDSVPEGVFLLAAYHMGYHVERIFGSRGAVIAPRGEDAEKKSRRVA